MITILVTLGKINYFDLGGSKTMTLSLWPTATFPEIRTHPREDQKYPIIKEAA